MRYVCAMVVGAAGMGGFAPAALATSTLDLNVNVIQAATFLDSTGTTPGFDFTTHFDVTKGTIGNYSGLVRLSEVIAVGGGVLSDLANITINGTQFTRASGALTANVATLTGEIMVTSGVVSSGFFELILDNGDAYVTNVIPNTGALRIIPALGGGQSGLIDGLTMSGVFTATAGTFAGVPLGAFNTTELFGSFLTIKLNPTGPSFIDTNSDLTLSAMIPAPSVSALGMLGLTFLAGRRRSRVAA